MDLIIYPRRGRMDRGGRRPDIGSIPTEEIMSVTNTDTSVAGLAGRIRNYRTHHEGTMAPDWRSRYRQSREYQRREGLH